MNTTNTNLESRIRWIRGWIRRQWRIQI